jgi:hypothetical protein
VIYKYGIVTAIRMVSKIYQGGGALQERPCGHDPSLFIRNMISNNSSDVMKGIVLSYDMVWYGMVWCGMIWYGMVWCGMVWYGMVWYGMVWYGVVWCGVVWYGMV